MKSPHRGIAKIYRKYGRLSNFTLYDRLRSGINREKEGAHMSIFALRTTSPDFLRKMIALRRAHRGLKQLDRIAPIGWRRNLFEPGPDNLSWFRAKDSYANECVLALAFESCPEYANSDGEVTFASVARHYPELADKLIVYGFQTAPGHRDGVTGEMLNIAWELTLRYPPFRMYSAYRYRGKTRRVA